jgi:hypothetical protein
MSVDCVGVGRRRAVVFKGDWTVILRYNYLGSTKRKTCLYLCWLKPLQRANISESWLVLLPPNVHSDYVTIMSPTPTPLWQCIGQVFMFLYIYCFIQNTMPQDSCAATLRPCQCILTQTKRWGASIFVRKCPPLKHCRSE